MLEMTEIPDDLKPVYAAATEKLTGGKLIAMQECFSCLIRLRQVQAALKDQPLVIHSARSKCDRPHPLLAAETALRMQFARLAKSTGLAKHYMPTPEQIKAELMRTREGRIKLGM